MRRLIIGCGYLGRRVARGWVASGDSVLALTRSEQRAAELRSDGIEPVIGDVTSASDMQRCFGSGDRFDTVLHAVGLDRTSGHTQREVYVHGLQNVLDALPVSLQRFVYISSTSVYGQDNGCWVDETSETSPVSDGGVVCLQAEQLLRTHPVLQGECKTFVLRLAGIYGPDRLIARLDSLRSQTPLGGNPDAWLNLIHVDDAALAVAACDHRHDSDTLLVADSQPQTRREFYSSICQLAGIAPPQFNSDATGIGSPGLNKRCLNQKLTHDWAVPLAYPTTTVGLPHALNESSTRS